VGSDGVTPLEDVMLRHSGVRKRPGRPADNLKMCIPARPGQSETDLGSVG